MRKIFILIVVLIALSVFVVLCLLGLRKSAPTEISFNILPADNPTPAAGVCFTPPAGSSVVVAVNIDIPSPRCQKVKNGQTLSVKNNTGTPVTLWFGKNKAFTIKLSAGETYTYPVEVQKYLADGVHILYGSPHQGPEIWMNAPAE